MKKLVQLKNDQGHYTADAVIVWCFDDRFSGSLSALAAALNLKRFDLVKIAGGAKSIASHHLDRDCQFVVDQILTSIRLHHTKSVIIMNHCDCGGYGGSAAFCNDSKKEMDAHQKELGKAKALLQEKVSVPVRSFYVDFEAIWEI